MPELGELPPPFVLTGPDGRPHELRPRAWRVPAGIVAEVEETGVPRGQGFRFSVFGAHNSDVVGLIGRARAHAEKEIDRQYLEPSTHRPGWMLRDDEVAGRLAWSGEGPYDVVVDGRTLTWEELGIALEPYEGCRFRLVIEGTVIEDTSDVDQPDASAVPLPLPPFSIS
jgi:hypothetical protein